MLDVVFVPPPWSPMRDAVSSGRPHVTKVPGVDSGVALTSWKTAHFGTPP
jgi:hypothetical protein